MNKKKLTSEEYEKRIEIILDMWDDHSCQQIGEKLGLTKQRISQYVFELKKQGLNIPNKKTYFGKREINKKIIEKYKGKWK